MKFILSGGGGGLSFNNNLAKMFLSVAFTSFLVLNTVLELIMFRPSKYHGSFLKEKPVFVQHPGFFSPGSTVSQPLKSEHTMFYISYRNECLVELLTLKFALAHHFFTQFHTFSRIIVKISMKKP